MTIDTDPFLDNTKDPKLARVQLLAAMELLNSMTDEAFAWTTNQSVEPVALTDGSSIDTDARLSNNFTIALTASGHTLENPSYLSKGMVLNWRITNGGAYTMSFGSKFKFAGGVAPTITSGADKVDLISGLYFEDTDTILCGVTQDLS